PTRGDILLNGKRLNDMPPHERGIAFVPQRPALYPHLTVVQNLQLAVRTKAEGGRRKAEKTGPPSAFHLPPYDPEGAAELLKITHLLKRLPADLSGGEKQRVALARAV